MKKLLYKHNWQVIIFFIIGFFIFADTAAAGIYYVNDTSTANDVYTSDTGDDANAGISSSPFRTIGHAISAAKAGDTIFIDAGTFPEAVSITVDSIALIGADSMLTVIDPPGDSAAANDAFFAISRGGLVISDLKITDADNGIYFSNVDGSRIENIYVYSNAGEGIILLSNSSDNNITDNFISNNGGNGIAIWSNSGQNNIIANSIEYSTNNGILLNTVEKNFILKNSTDSNGLTGISLQNAKNSQVTANNSRYNQFNGINLYFQSDNNIFTQNTLAENLSYQILISNECSSDTFNFNNIKPRADDTGKGIWNNVTGDTIFDFTRNWWNTTDVSAIYQKILSSEGNIIYKPYRLGAVSDVYGADTIAPDVPYNIQIDTETLSNAIITWSLPTLDEDGKPISGFAGIHIYRNVNVADTVNWASDDLLVFTSNTTDTLWIDTDIFSHNHYYYRLTAFDTGLPINESFFTDTFTVFTNVAPIAPILPDSAARMMDTLILNASTASDSNGDTLFFKWSLDADSQGAFFTMQYDSITQVIFDTAGVYNVHLYVSDSIDTEISSFVMDIATLNKGDFSSRSGKIGTLDIFDAPDFFKSFYLFQTKGILDTAADMNDDTKIDFFDIIDFAAQYGK